MNEPNPLRFKGGSLVFRIEGGLFKTGEKPPYTLDFSSRDIDELADSFFEWMRERDLEFAGVFGTEMEETK